MSRGVRRTVSLLLTVLVLVVAPVVRADADRAKPPSPRPFTFLKATSTTNYGSGALAPWQAFSHGVVGNPATADVLLVGDSITTGSWTFIFNPTVMTGQVARLVAGVGSSKTVLWVDVQVARTGQAAAVQLADQRNSGWVNNSIREKCTAPCVVVPWSWWLASSPNRLPAYVPDGVHTDGAGRDFRAAVLMAKIGAL